MGIGRASNAVNPRNAHLPTIPAAVVTADGHVVDSFTGYLEDATSSFGVLTSRNCVEQ